MISVQVMSTPMDVDKVPKVALDDLDVHDIVVTSSQMCPTSSCYEAARVPRSYGRSQRWRTGGHGDDYRSGQTVQNCVPENQR